MTEGEIIKALQAGEPFKGLRGITVDTFDAESTSADQRFDVSFRLRFGQTETRVFGEIKNICTPKLAQQVAPWLARFKQIQQEAAFALVCPSLSQEAQSICIDNGIDFIDLNGNISINVPGKFFLQRIGLRGRIPTRYPLYRNPFLGKSSRVVRVLLENPREWTLTAIADQLTAESRRTQGVVGQFEISLASVSRTLRSLEEELFVRRRNSMFLVSEPKRLLLRWAEKYKERYPWYLRRSFKVPNPFGKDVSSVVRGLRDSAGGQGTFALTGSAAASLTAPFVDIETIDIFISDEQVAAILRNRGRTIGFGPEIRVVFPYDFGVFLYSRLNAEVPLVSEIQTFLDLYARGGRDLKQADYLLETVIMPRWERR